MGPWHLEEVMSELDKIAREIKAAKKVYDRATVLRTKLQNDLMRANNGVNDAAKVLAGLRQKLAMTAEGSEPNYALYV
jgi:hypothetical protein